MWVDPFKEKIPKKGDANNKIIKIFSRPLPSISFAKSVPIDAEKFTWKNHFVGKIYLT